MPELLRDGIAIAFEIEGPDHAPALLFSHSLGSDLHLWSPQVPRFADRYRVIRYDLRGHGRSGAPARPYTLDQLAGDALAVLDAVRVSQAGFIGISIGGLIGMWLAIHASPRIGKLVLANTGARIGTQGSWNQRMEAVSSRGLAAIAPSVLERWLTPEFAAARPDVLEGMRRSFEATSPEGYMGCCEALRDADLRDRVDAIKAPTLIVTGTDDRSTPPSLGSFLHSAIPGSSLVELPAAHISSVEQSERFSEAVLSFLEN